MKHRGFTLVEFSITMAVLIVVVMVTIPAFQTILTQARNTTAKAALGELRAAIESYSAGEIAAGRGSRFGTGTGAGWPTVTQINEAKYGGTNIVLPSRNVPENPWARFVFTQDFDRVLQNTGAIGGGAKGPPQISNRILTETLAYAGYGDDGGGGEPPPPPPPQPAGWFYNPNTGQIWAASNVNGENTY